jgi:plastocyanin
MLLLSGCGGGGGTDSTSAETSGGAGSSETTSGGSGEELTVSEFEFHPAEITVPVGTTIKVTNEGPSPHTVTSKESGGFESGTIKQGETKTVTLTEAGTFAYFCSFHPFMTGTITVE